jgi:hypothetical protein
MRDGIGKLIAAVNAIGNDMAQLWEPSSQLLQQRNGPMAVLNVGGMNVDGKQEAVGVGDNVPLAPIDTFAGVEAPWTASLGCRCALAVDDRYPRPRLSSESSAGLSNQGCDDLLPPSSVAPSVKIALDRRVRRKLLRQGTPLAASGQNVKNSLQNLA